jgi:8-oxo-dGTP pyrophosphatase MutT (NUDIX family)
MIRRHLQFILSGPVADQIEILRQQWDPVMAARAPAHLSLVYPEEWNDEGLLLTRTLEASSHTPPLVITLGQVAGEDGGRGGVWYLVTDVSNTWSTLRATLLAAPFCRLAVEPHVTIVHPRTSNRGAQALAALSGVSIAGEVALSEIVHTETDPSGMRVLNRFPLLASTPTRVVGAVLRKRGQVLLCLRSRNRPVYPGVWDIPGGHLEKSESAEQGLMRELQEELGIQPDIPIGGPWITRQVGGFELSVFIIDRWQGEPQNLAVHEHDEVRWVSVAELSRLNLAHPSYVELLTQAVRLPIKEHG